MGYKKLLAEFEGLDAAELLNEEVFRYWLLKLLFELSSNTDSVSARLSDLAKSHALLEGHYKKLLDLQLRRRAPMDRRPPQPKSKSGHSNPAPGAAPGNEPAGE